MTCSAISFLASHWIRRAEPSDPLRLFPNLGRSFISDGRRAQVRRLAGRGSSVTSPSQLLDEQPVRLGQHRAEAAQPAIEKASQARRRVNAAGVKLGRKGGLDRGTLRRCELGGSQLPGEGGARSGWERLEHQGPAEQDLSR